MMTQRDNTNNTHWTGFAASIPGGGHIRHGIPCQDASAVMTAPRPAVIVCDGRGSASLSHFGAQGAVSAFRSQMSILEPFLVNILDVEEEKQDQWIKFCRIMYRTLMQVKYDLAEQHNTEEKEFDCTVAFAIAGEKHIGCFQVGDGSIVVRQNGICKAVFPPEKGEFANQTHFLRPGGEEEMKFQYTLLDAEVNSGIAVTSDGPEHLMFRLSDMTPGKIFDMFLDDLRKEELSKQDLMDYLTRREWADDPRGSDDRSLALLARIGDEPVVVPEPEVHVAEPEVKPEQEVVPASKPEAMSEPEAETEVQEVVPAATEEPKKKAIPYWTLAIVSSLAIGLLAETACLVKQHQTITRQQQEIQFLNQRLTQKNAQPEKVQPKIAQSPVGKTVPVPVKKETKATHPQQPQGTVLTGETKVQDVPHAEKKANTKTTANPENGNTHKEDSHDEM